MLTGDACAVADAVAQKPGIRSGARSTERSPPRSTSGHARHEQAPTAAANPRVSAAK
jgi:hypothetical protein